MNGWVWWMPIGVITLAVALYAFRLGWIAANITETDAINAYAARYVDEVGPPAKASDCAAMPGDIYGHWLVVRCIDQSADLIHSYYVNRFGGLANQDRMKRADPDAATTIIPRT